MTTLEWLQALALCGGIGTSIVVITPPFQRILMNVWRWRHRDIYEKLEEYHKRISSIEGGPYGG